MSSRFHKIFIFALVILFFTASFGENKTDARFRAESEFIPFHSLWFSNFFTSYFFFNLPVFLMSPIPQDVVNDQDTTEAESEPDTTFIQTDTTYERPPLFPQEGDRRDAPGSFNVGKRNTRNPEGFETSVEVDSVGSSVLSRELFDSLDIAYPYELELDEYLELRKKTLTNEVWDSLLTRYDLKKALSGGDLARLIGQATGLSIPIPPNPVMGIFGKPEISINVNGEVNLRIGFRWDSQNLGTVSAFGQSQATPMFNQDIRVRVSGQIGDKLKLSTDWNTRRTFDYNNEFKIGYEGYDDDIIKLVEVGNVTLPLESQLISGGQALFGVRADFQFGPLFLKTLFSQRRGEKKTMDVRGGASKQYFQLRAYDFAKNHFFLDTVYKWIYRDYFKYSTPTLPTRPIQIPDPDNPGDSVTIDPSYYRVKGDIEVWESSNDVREVHSARAVAYAELEGKQLRNGETYDPALKGAGVSIEPGEVQRGHFQRLDTTRYRVDRNLGTLTILNLRQDRIYAVGYRIEGESTVDTDDIYYGELSTFQETADTLILKLIHVPQMQPEFDILWDRQMKNIYSINATNVNKSETRIGIWYTNQSNDSTDVLEGAPDKLVTIFGVDQVNNGTGSPPPDGQFDLVEPFFDARYGEITFPHPEPFRGGLRDYFTKLGNPDLAEQYVYNDIYDTTYDVARRNTAKDRFLISGEVSGRSTNRISLGAFNLAPGSVSVYLDGRKLREYEDYVVDYYAGTLTLRNERAALPNANLKIEYEQHDIFNISTRTLAGIRGDYMIYNGRKLDASAGFTVMHYDQSAVIDRVRLGDEPVSNTMLGIDGKINWDTPWLTEMLDALPFYDTKAQSSITAKSELAMILPEPNKRYSEVASDNGEPVVYIDDFEGAQRYIPLGLNPTQWQHSSQPVDSSIAATDELRAEFRGRMYWWQYFIPRIPIKSVYPNRSTIQGRQNLSPLEINFDPGMRGIYNKNPEFLDTLNPEYDPQTDFSRDPFNRPKIWAGMQRLFSSFNTNFDTENIEYIEIMMRVVEAETGAEMYIDLGQISEDIIPNNELDTEDGITNANPLPNNIIDVGEDRGIDALFNEAEQETYPYPLNLENDPARDDYGFNFTNDDQTRVPEDFLRYNNFEGNARVSEIGQFPDSEILNDNNGQSISTGNAYFSYKVNLLTDPLVNKQIVGGGNNGWYLFRIPIRSPSRRVGNPLFSNIQYIRLWFKGGSVKAQIADWRLVGSQWQRISNFADVPPNDSVLQISFVNREENSNAPDYYTLPPGVSPPKQLNSPDPQQEIYLNEQSMAVTVNNLRYNDERMAVRIFPPMDIFNYKKLKFFIHGDGTMPDNIVKGAIPRAYAFIRFGIDSSNYYEYRTPLLRGWQDIEIDLNELTAIKQQRDTLRKFDEQTFQVPGEEFSTFTIRGNPILTRVLFFGAGIANPAERFPNELTTTMWINELRLISPERGADWGSVSNIDMKLADLGNISGHLRHVMPNFHALEERFGNRINTTEWSVSVNGNLEKFAPKSFTQTKIPITYTHAEFVEDPEFVANNDVRLDNAASAIRRRAETDTTLSQDQANRQAEEFIKKSQTVRVQDSWALTGIQLGIPIEHWSIKETLNKLKVSYSYSQEFERSPVVAQRFSWIWKLQSEYSNKIPDFLKFSPLGWAKEAPLIGTYGGLTINPLPSNITLGLNMQRQRTTEQSRFLPFPSPIFRDFSAQRNLSFSWKIAEGGFINPSFDYNVSTISSLVNLEFDENGRQRAGSEIADAMFLNEGALVNFGQNSQHQQTVTLNFKPVLPNIAGMNNYLDMNGNYTVNYNWNNPRQPRPEIRDIVKNASYNATARFKWGLRLKSMADDWFGIRGGGGGTRMPGGSPQRPAAQDTTKRSIFGHIGKVFKTIFLDYEKIDFSINQTTASNNPGVFGGTGMNNFWGRGFLMQESERIYGPSFAYQMGMVSSPHGGFNIVPSGSFPWFGFNSYDGLRPPNGVMQENYNQNTQFNIETNRPLWEGAKLSLNWKSALGYNRNQTVITDEDGNPTYTNIVAMQSLQRTYLGFPTIFGLELIGGTIEDVVQEYEARAAIIEAEEEDKLLKNQKLQTALADAFHDELELFSFTGGSVGKFLPAVNWTLTWEGIEKYPFVKDIAKRISLEHAYQSQYQENAQITDNGRAIQGQQIQFGFQPMVGVQMGFDEKKMGGILNATFRWNSMTSYQLQSSNRAIISRQSTEEIQAQASYTLQGWEFPLLGFNFKNDLEFSFMASLKYNKRATYNIMEEESYENDSEGRTLDGNTQITIEPRARYNVSNILTASVFMRYEGTFTEGAAQPGFSTYQFGMDLRIAISGGR